MESTLIAPYSNTQATATVLSLNRCKSEEKELAKPFGNNLDHLKALELEATLMLATTFIRRNGSGKELDYEPSFPEVCRGKNLEEAIEIFKQKSAENRQREEASILDGSELSFISFCKEWNLDVFEKQVVLLLLMQNIAPDFTSVFKDCNFEKDRGYGISIGTILGIIGGDLVEQLSFRRYFSIEGTLIRDDLIQVNGSIDDTSNILDEKVSLNERLVRFILGDNNLYNSCFRYIKREQGNVSLDQVVLAEGVKDELVKYMEKYQSVKNSQDEMADFYGYGTALTFLFYGPSGTGKSMMAKALASKFKRTIFSLTADDLKEMPGSYQEIISTLFREAALQNGIVFFDECDDVFEKDTRASRALLIEIEKAKCVIILATNRAVSLDPALERRISIKTYFPIPVASERRKLWEVLLPPSAILSADVNLDDFAEKYQFTGGLIKNSIFLAMTLATSREGCRPIITNELLHSAAKKQIASIADEKGICKTISPTVDLKLLPIDDDQRKRLMNLSSVWKLLKNRNCGLSLVLTASDVKTAEETAYGVAHECGLSIKSFDLQEVLSRNHDDRITDPVTQRAITPLQYAFSPTASDASMILFVDHENLLENVLSTKKGSMNSILMLELLSFLRKHTGLFCIVSKEIGSSRLPPEFSVHKHLTPPNHIQQEQCWRNHLGGLEATEEAVIAQIIKDYPLHPSEIEFVMRQATTHSIINRMADRPSFEEVKTVLKQFKNQPTNPLLFGAVQ